ncbi:hypothetical protein BH24ACT14_BH24ACT14_03950 [soil metagenome]
MANSGPPGRADLSGPVELLVDGRATYIKAPAGMPAPTPWFSISLEGGGGQSPLSDLPQIGSDPAAGLAYLRGVSDDVEEIGSDQVRGVATTHYRAVVNIGEVLAEAPPRDRDQLRHGLRMLGLEQLPMDVWLDAEGLLRRQVTAIDLSQSEFFADPGRPAAAQELVTTVEFYDFGTEVDITPPPADQVTKLEDMLNR